MPQYRRRVLLAEANQALLGLAPSLRNARRKALEAYEFAKCHHDELLLFEARARYKQAVIEARAASEYGAEDPVRLRLKACRYAFEALHLAAQFHSDRLAARIHTLLGNLFLEFPFCDCDYAAQQWEAAVQRMSQHEDMDYLVDRIAALGKKLDAPVPRPEDPVIFAVDGEAAFRDTLEKTSRLAEKAVILAAVKWFGNNDRAIATALRVGRRKVQKILDGPHQATTPLATHHVIFRVKVAFAFSRPLAETIKAVERAVILAAWIRYGCDKATVKDKLHVGFEKVVWALAAK